MRICKGVHCVDLGESFQTHIFLQNLASIQPRTSLVKFARSLAMQQQHESQAAARGWADAAALLAAFGREAEAEAAGALLFYHLGEARTYSLLAPYFFENVPTILYLQD